MKNTDLLQTILAVSIVDLARLGIAQHLVGSADLLELYRDNTTAINA